MRVPAWVAAAGIAFLASGALALMRLAERPHESAPPGGARVHIPGPTALEEGDPRDAAAPTAESRASVSTRSSPPSYSTTGLLRPHRPVRPAVPTPRSTSRQIVRRGTASLRDALPPQTEGPIASVAPSDPVNPIASDPPASPSPETVPVPATPPATAAVAAPMPLPRLTAPVPLEQPPLDPVMKVDVTMGTGGMHGLEERSARGRLRVRLLVRADGSVGRVDILVSSGDPALDAAARRGLLRWRFIPARADGEPIDAFLSFWVTFHD